MIGVTFALHESFGVAGDVESEAFTRMLLRLARRYAPGREEAILGRAVRIEPSSLGTAAGVEAAVRAAFADDADALRKTPIAAMFRTEAAEALDGLFTPYADVIPTLRTLAELNVPCAALSTGWPSIDRRKADRAGFDGEIVFAADLAEPENLLAALAHVTAVLRLPAERVYYVGTRASELTAARAIGMKTIRIDRLGAGNRSPAADFTVSSFAALWPVLSGPYTRGLLELRSIMRTALVSRDGHYIASDAFDHESSDEP